MNRLQVDLGCSDSDRVRALRDGRVQVEGVELAFVAPAHAEEVLYRMLAHAEFDAGEVSFGSYVAGRSRGGFPFVALPVFTGRMFRHSAAYVREDAGIAHPADLRGKRVGVPEYQQTAATWLRGILQDDYGVHPTDIHWRYGGLEEPGRRGSVRVQLPQELQVEPIPPGETLSHLLATGELDALFSARLPSVFLQGVPGVRRLFPDYPSVEADYYRRTSIFPIMHLIVLREDFYRRHRWVAQSLTKAFAEAKQVCADTMYDTTTLPYMLPWAGHEIERTHALMGQDFWPYGLEPNRQALETFLRYSYDQGIAVRRMEPEELFAAETLDVARV